MTREPHLLHIGSVVYPLLGVHTLARGRLGVVPRDDWLRGAMHLVDRGAMCLSDMNVLKLVIQVVQIYVLGYTLEFLVSLEILEWANIGLGSSR